jgi:hypothetical protein
VRNPKKKNVIAVNMSAEIKANRLLPEQNDKISIAGKFQQLACGHTLFRRL